MNALTYHLGTFVGAAVVILAVSRILSWTVFRRTPDPHHSAFCVGIPTVLFTGIVTWSGLLLPVAYLLAGLGVYLGFPPSPRAGVTPSGLLR
jgi:hypothetical protein